MRKGTVISNAIVIILIIFCIFLCTGCDLYSTKPSHVHSFSSDWSHDENYHWQACSSCDEVRNKAEHNWNEGFITTPPTNSTDGVKTYTCKTCGHIKYEVIPMLSHVHTYSESWSYDDEYHWHEMNCGHEGLEGIETRADLEEHSYNNEDHTCICGKREILTITFVDYNEEVLKVVSKEYGERVMLFDEVDSPEKSDSIFVGWELNGEIITSLELESSITLKAKYEVGHNVVFVVNNRVFDSQLVVDGGDAHAPNENPSIDGYAFKGWEDYTNITSDRIVNALFDPIQYVLKFEMPDGTIIGETKTISIEDVFETPQIDDYWFDWQKYQMFIFTNWKYKDNQNWKYSDIQEDVINQYKANSSKLPTITIVANFETEYKLPVIVLEEGMNSTDTTLVLNMSIVLPSDSSCYLYAIDLEFSFGSNLSINGDTVNTSTAINSDTIISQFNNKTRLFSLIWTSGSEGVSFTQQQIIDTIEFSRSNNKITINSGNFVLSANSSIVIASSNDASYSEMQKVKPVVVYKSK